MTTTTVPGPACRRELQEALGRVADEASWVPGTRLYQSVCSEVDKLQEILAQRGKDLEAVAHERDVAVAQAVDKRACEKVRGGGGARQAGLQAGWCAGHGAVRCGDAWRLGRVQH